MNESEVARDPATSGGNRLLLPSADRREGSAVAPIALTGPEAARFTRLSTKTLDRHAEAGEPLGRIKVGRRVLFLKAALESWLASKANTSPSQTNTH